MKHHPCYVAQQPLAYALTAHIWIHPDILQEFWLNAQLIFYEGRLSAISSWVMGKAIILNEHNIREVLRLNDDNNDLTFTHQELNTALTQVGYHVWGHARAITKSGFIKPCQFLVT
ncbi:putative EF-hand domain-containing protein [Helianthus anomalus]